jgi:15-cis-phytoene synthase
MKQIFDRVSMECSVKTTKSYSTSFSLGIRFLTERFQNPIYAIYGFVRFADEIVDTFHEFDKEKLLKEFKADTFKAIDAGISLNPILNSFQWAVNKYNIDREHIETFLRSMEMDLEKNEYNQNAYEEYILGSAEVVGLMCLRVFTEGNDEMYQRLAPSAQRLGAAFQKINFLRDLKADSQTLGRMYFPNLDLNRFDCEMKKQIEAEIEEDFNEAYKGIVQLPKDARLGVYVAYVYYLQLFKKIQKLSSDRILEERIRIPNNSKFTLFVQSYVKHSFNMI